MIDPTAIERLRTRPPTPESPVLSVYLDVDQSRAANLNREFAAALKTRLRTIENGLREGDREAFRAAAAHVEHFVAHYQPHATTLALFSEKTSLFWSGELRAPIATDVRWEPTPFLRPLLEALE